MYNLKENTFTMLLLEFTKLMFQVWCGFTPQESLDKL